MARLWNLHGPVVESVAAAHDSRRAADRTLALGGTEPVLSFDTARSRLITAAIENAVAEQPDLIDPRTVSLIRDDPEGARTLLRYLDAGSDASRVAADLRVHPSTVRYRLRRVVDSTGIDLQDAEDRLAVHVQLRCGLRRTPRGG